MTSLADHVEVIKKLKENFWQRSWTIADQQAAAREDPGARGPVWVSRTTIRKPPEESLIDALEDVIQGLKKGNETWTRPKLVDVPVEWMGGRAGADSKSPEPQIPEYDKYKSLDSETDADAPVVIFVHGGGFYYGSPVWARPTTGRLAQLTKGRCLAIQYRYATAGPFPSQLLDLFVVYLSLLAPPLQSFHDAVPAKRIILAGESVGLSLCVAFVQVLSRLRTTFKSSHLTFHGVEVALSLPAGIAGVSGSFDNTGGLPSWDLNGKYDYQAQEQPIYTAAWPAQPLWPSNPPRGDVYCETSALTHPLVCPIAIDNFRGSPPLWLACGEERGADGVKLIAQKAARQGVAVSFVEYEAMPHCWTSVLRRYPHSERAMKQWAMACVEMVKGNFSTRAEAVAFDSLETKLLDVTRLTTWETREIMSRIAAKRDVRVAYTVSALRSKPLL